MNFGFLRNIKKIPWENRVMVGISCDGNPEKWPVFMVGPPFFTMFRPALGQLSIILFFYDGFRGF